MYFALLYIIFFTLNIFILMRFQGIWGIPVSFVVAGVGLFCTYEFNKHQSFCDFPLHYSKYFKFFIFYIFLLSSIYFIYGFGAIISRIVKFQFLIFDAISEKLLFIISSITTIIFSILLYLRSYIIKWIVFSSLICTIHWGIIIFIGKPMPFFFYYGLFDMFMLFGWLMIITILIKREYSLNV